ncbi:MAG: hypothetical protein M1419_05695 [Bacteroidetes bacterium]|nr:hypothetical protein [Bacteroidota bacterium]
MFRIERFIENESVILNEVKRNEESLLSLNLRFFDKLRMTIIKPHTSYNENIKIA